MRHCESNEVVVTASQRTMGRGFAVSSISELGVMNWRSDLKMIPEKLLRLRESARGSSVGGGENCNDCELLGR